MTSIDGDLLDAVEEELRGRTKDDAIHSGELADKVGIDDGEANPKTREVIRTLMEERGLPIASANCGYWMLESDAQLRIYVNDLRGRIAGIEERIEMVQENYKNAIADGGQIHVDASDVRQEIKQFVEDNDPALRDDLAIEAADTLGCDPAVVQEQLDEMVEAGFAYLVEDGEVRLP